MYLSTHIIPMSTVRLNPVHENNWAKKFGIADQHCPMQRCVYTAVYMYT